ncbi:MAG: reverse transcriptase-like protein [Candidatus Latescibacteria bacterium]|nr:reverse transcriptase-like protein [bacterium]MBD3424259.1 reverse transcriptase-like protein [Candidatus Latescibacterota bacterium]
MNRKLATFIAALAEGAVAEKARVRAGYGNYTDIEKDLSAVMDRIGKLKPMPVENLSGIKAEYLTIYCDGASRGNPGPSSAAAVAYLPSGEELISRAKKLGRTTNNVAEYRALIMAMELALELGADKVFLKLDSQLVVNQMNGDYRIKSKHLRELADRARQLACRFSRCEFHHIGRDKNKVADKLARDVMRKRGDSK